MAQSQQKTVTSTYTAEKFQEDAKRLMDLMEQRVREIEKSFNDAQDTFNKQKKQVEELESEINKQTKTIEDNKIQLATMQNQLQELMTKNIEFYEQKEKK